MYGSVHKRKNRNKIRPPGCGGVRREKRKIRRERGREREREREREKDRGREHHINLLSYL